LINGFASKKFIKEYNDGNLYYFSYIGRKEDSKDKTACQDIMFESHNFYSNKNFSNIFFDDKQNLMNRLIYFQNGGAEYLKLGIPYTLGFLFFGDPGCGKTSTIKAMANYTKRHIIEIPLSKIKTCSELKKIFFTDTINGHYVPPDKKIIVLEDIDCMGSIVQKRETLNNQKNVTGVINKMEEQIENGMIEDKNLYRHKDEYTDDSVDRKNELYERLMRYQLEGEDNDKLTLSYILNLIDGVLEQPGRILVITTNHPEKLDSALIRPGRIDMKVHFRKASSTVSAEILELFFNKVVDKEIKEKLPDNQWTPAEVFELCFNLTDFNKVVEKLTKDLVD
jgi:mitochondrial chaperone BCS1